MPFCIKYKTAITKFRLSSHNLMIETGRHRQCIVSACICSTCNDDIEDEFHFVLKYLSYNALRCKYVNSYFVVTPPYTNYYNYLIPEMSRNYVILVNFRTRLIFKCVLICYPTDKYY